MQYTSRPVTVTTHDGPRSGFLLAWQRRGSAWWGFVEYRTGVGQVRLGWFDAARLAPGGG